MPSVSTATVTAKAGPGNTVTAQALTGVTEFKFAAGPERPFLTITCDQGIKEYDINASTTLTCTLTAGGNAVFVVS